MIKYPINAALSPNTESEDISQALRGLLLPGIWKGNESIKKVTDWFSSKYQTPYVFTVNSGRSALFLLLKSFGIGSGDEVLLQAFTCVAVPNSILWNGAKPIYVDIDATLNLDVNDMERKITDKTKAVIVQHTFGYPADIVAIKKLCDARNIILIEDCAHALGTRIKGKMAGMYGDAAFFSFGRDKVVSSVFGGLALLDARRSSEAKKFETLITRVPSSRSVWTIQQLLHPLLFAFILPTYSIGIGKLLLVFFQKLGILSFPVYAEEKRGKQPSDFPATYPNVLAYLLEPQLYKLNRYLDQRRRIAAYYADKLYNYPSFTFPKYNSDSGYLRFPLIVDNPERITKQCRKQGILLGNWYQHTVDPKGVNTETSRYIVGSCPEAERISRKVVNLPTLISEEAAEQVIRVLVQIAK